MTLGKLAPNLYLDPFGVWSSKSFSPSCDALKKLLSVMFLGRFNSPSATELETFRLGDPSTTLKELTALVAVAGIVTGDLPLCSITGTSRPC